MKHEFQTVESPESDPWASGIEALRALPDGGVALLVGATDRGKTTFAALAARMLASELPKVAIIDADIGQSEIGPPGTVGVAWADADTERLASLRPAALWFVGGFAPPAVALELVVALTRAVRWARENGARRILIDTGGFVHGAAARRLKAAKAQAVAPDLILGVGRGDEIRPLVEAMRAASGAAAVFLETPPEVGRKPAALRATRRLTRLSRALDGAREIALPLGKTATVAALLGSGEPLTPEMVRWIDTALNLPPVNAVLRAEKQESALTLFVAGPKLRGGAAWERDSGPVARHFGCSTVRAVALSGYTGTLLGLGDDGGRLVSVGVFDRLDGEREEMIVYAPESAATVERVRFAQFGRVRVRPDGAWVSDIRPGEI